MTTPSALAGRVALVTGGARNIGRAIACGLAADGAAVLVNARTSRADAEETAERIRAAGGRAALHFADVTDPAAVASMVEATLKEFGRLDFLVNNAAIRAETPFADIRLQDWQQILATVLDGAFLCTQQAVRLMKAQQPRGGRIINNGSISAHTPRPHSAPYTATKHAITGLTKSTSLDGRPFDIACGQIDIGNAATEMTARFAVGALQANGEVAVEPRMNVRHVVDAVLYMASLPLDANVQFLTVMATGMPFIGRG